MCPYGHRGGYILFKCCGVENKWSKTHIFEKPYYRFIGFGVCPRCGTKHFLEFKQILEGDDYFKEKKRELKGDAAQKEYNKWKQRLNNSCQGTFSKEFFYYGTFKEEKNGYYKTYRTNFNNEKEFLFKAKVKII